MLALDLVSNDIPPLKHTDTGKMAIQWMDEFKVSHLPVLKDGLYTGLVSDADLLDLNTPEETLESQLKDLERPFIFESQHVYSVIKMINDLSLTAVPVLDQEERYSGLISIQHLVSEMSNIAAINNPGGILVLEINDKDYSMSEIARIVEGNNAIILSSYVTSVPESTKMQVTLKINKTDLGAVVQTFNRYNYTVSASFQETTHQEDLKRRYDELMNYLNI